jgi:hypothetical protein
MLSATVFDQVGLTVAWRRFAPIIKGPHRHTLPHRRTQSPAARADAAARLAHRAQQPIDGRRADIQQGASHHRIEPHMTVALHTLDQHRQ